MINLLIAASLPLGVIFLLLKIPNLSFKIFTKLCASLVILSDVYLIIQML
jgi:hypothetical protein